MKKIFTLFIAGFMGITLNAQYFSDDWTGGTLTSNNAWTTVTSDAMFDWVAQDLGSPGNFYAAMTNYNGTSNPVTSWLISPVIDISAATSPTLTFMNAYNFTGDPLQVFISTDYTGGDPATLGTWTDLSSLVTWSAGGFAWTASGNIDLTPYISSTAYIAFKYTGTGADGSNWEIDDFDVSEPGAGPGTQTIYDIQYTTSSPADSPFLGQVVTTYGIVTGIILNGPDAGAYFIQDGAGAWNGLYIYDTDAVVAIGDSVEVTGEVDEFNLGTSTANVTELKNVSAYTVINSGNTLPATTDVTTISANMEEYEGVLIRVLVAECTNNTEGFGLWSLNDGSGVIKGDDEIFAYHLTAVVGNWYDVTGIGHYSFDEAKILPRDITDIIEQEVGGVNESSVDFTIYPNPANDMVTLNIAANSIVEIYSISGALVYTGVSPKTIDVSSLNTGIYQVAVTQNGTRSVEKLIIR